MNRRLKIAVCLLALAASPAFFAAQTKPVATKPLLPDAFAGWVADAAPKKIVAAAQADAANATALTEYGFVEALQAAYSRESLKLTLQLLRFQDATGAYGAYSFFRQNNWAKESIGAGAASRNGRVLFWQGNLVVDAKFSKIDPMSGSDLRELAHQLPIIEGRAAVLPPLLANLPQPQLQPQTTHYAIGAAGYTGGGGVLPPELVNFDLGAEAVTANYQLRSGPATLTLIDYPTPQMAAAQEDKIRAYLKAGAKAQPAWPKLLQDSDIASLEVKHSGPIVALLSGDAIPEESHKLLATVHFGADLVTLPRVGDDNEIAKTGKLLLGIATIVIIGSAAAILLGFFLGGGRALYRIARGRPASSVYESEFIRLNLRD